MAVFQILIPVSGICLLLISTVLQYLGNYQINHNLGKFISVFATKDRAIKLCHYDYIKIIKNKYR